MQSVSQTNPSAALKALQKFQNNYSLSKTSTTPDEHKKLTIDELIRKDEKMRCVKYVVAHLPVEKLGLAVPIVDAVFNVVVNPLIETIVEYKQQHPTDDNIAHDFPMIGSAVDDVNLYAYLEKISNNYMYRIAHKQMKQAEEYITYRLAKFDITKQESENLLYILQCGHDYTDRRDWLFGTNSVEDEVTKSAHSAIYKLLPKAPKNDDSAAKSVQDANEQQQQQQQQQQQPKKRDPHVALKMYVSFMLGFMLLILTKFARKGQLHRTSNQTEIERVLANYVLKAIKRSQPKDQSNDQQE